MATVASRVVASFSILVEVVLGSGSVGVVRVS